MKRQQKIGGEVKERKIKDAKENKNRLFQIIGGNQGSQKRISVEYSNIRKRSMWKQSIWTTDS